MADKGKDAWEKWDIILKPLGGLLTALAVASVGFFGSQYLDRRQTTETNIRLYAELMSNREKADSDLRKEMFNSIITAFLEPKSRNLDEEILALELLAYNFHDVIDLGPLFKHVDASISVAPEDGREDFKNRLEKVAQEVIDKQLAALEEVGFVEDEDVIFEDLEREHVIEVFNIVRPIPSEQTEQKGSETKRVFYVEAHEHDPQRKELRVRLEVSLLHKKEAEPKNEPRDEKEVEVEADMVFRVGFFDFPMIDNTRLSKGQRVAIVMRQWQPFGARLAIVGFPGSRASLKEKPYYDEVVEELVKTRKKLSAPN